MDGSLFLSFVSVFLSLLALTLSISILIIKIISTQQTCPCQCHSNCGSSSVIASEKQEAQSVTQQVPPMSSIEDEKLVKKEIEDEKPVKEEIIIDAKQIEDEKPVKKEIIIDAKQMGLVLHEERWHREWISTDKQGYNVVSTPAGGVSQDGSIIEVLRFKGDCGHPMTGKLDMSLLEPNATYEASAVFMLTKSVVGSLYLKLESPDTTYELPKEDMKDKPLNEWFAVPLGDFTMPAVAVGQIKFEMNTAKLKKQTGLIMKGVDLHPARS